MWMLISLLLVAWSHHTAAKIDSAILHESPSLWAAPHLILVYGGTLKDTVFLTKAKDNHLIMASLASTPAVPIDELRGRTVFDLGLCWGVKWSYVNEHPERLRRISPSDVTQQGKFYPSTKNHPAVLLLSAPSDPLRGLVGTSATWKRLSPVGETTLLASISSRGELRRR